MQRATASGRAIFWWAWSWSTAGRSRIHVFEGNWRDAKTVPEVLRDLEARFGLARIVFVGDRGMVTSQNLDAVRAGGHGYIVGRNRRRSGEVFDYIQSATGPWIECPVGSHAAAAQNEALSADQAAREKAQAQAASAGVMLPSARWCADLLIALRFRRTFRTFSLTVGSARVTALNGEFILALAA